MRCDQTHSMIEAYFDGELEDDDARVKIARHLEECAGCANVLQELKAEGEVYRGYEPKVEIKPELWAMVQSRIVDGRLELASGNVNRLSAWFRQTFALPQVSGWATAALVVLAVGLTVTFMKYARPEETKAPTPVTQSAKDVSPAQPHSGLKPEPKEADNSRVGVLNTQRTERKGELAAAASRVRAPNLSRPRSRPNSPDQLVREAEQKYLTAIAMLTRTVESRRSRLDAPTAARLEQSLAAVDRSIADTRKVVQKHPADPVAVQYMLNAYSRKVDVLREMIGR